MIGIFDSGAGGLSVYNEIRKLNNIYSFIYLADSLNAPYGTKSIDEIKSLTLTGLKFLQKKGATLIVIACNTASVAGLDFFRKEISVPIVGLVPAIKPAVYNSNRIAILATPVTAKSQLLNEYILKFAKGKIVEVIPNSSLVPFIESGKLNSAGIDKEINKINTILSEKSVEGLVFGCTHFVFLKDKFRKVNPKLKFYDSGYAVALRVNKIIKEKPTFKANKSKFYTTGNTRLLASNIERFLNMKVEVEGVNLV